MTLLENSSAAFVQKKGSRSYEQLVSCVVESLGAEQLFKDSRRILIKPNLVTAKTACEGVTTDIDLIRHLVEAIHTISNAEIIVGESSLLDTDDVFKYLNVHALEKSGCRVENFDEGEWVEVQSPFSLLFKNFLIPRIASESDVVINLAKMKTHELTGVTLGIKNFFGLLSAGGRRYAHICDIDRGIVDVYSYFECNKTVLSIIDGLIALSGRSGPIVGMPVKTDCVVAGTNTILCDAAAVRIMGAEPRHIEHMKIAADILNIDINEIPEGGGVSKMEFELPPMAGGETFKVSEWLTRKKFYKYPVQKDSQLCTSCRRCERLCPRNIVTIENSTFGYTSSDCVHCLCCVEACDTGAITYEIRNESLFLLLRSFWKILKALRKYKNKFLSGGRQNAI